MSDADQAAQACAHLLAETADHIDANTGQVFGTVLAGALRAMAGRFRTAGPRADVVMVQEVNCLLEILRG